MVARLLADLVLLAHFAFVAFAIGGGLLVLRWGGLRWLHWPVLAWAVSIELYGGICPLTPLENALRQAGGESGYEGGFVEHHLVPILYPGELTREIQVGLGLALAGFNVGIYALRWLRLRRSRRDRDRLADARSRPRPSAPDV
jgi:hypothetical protein